MIIYSPTISIRIKIIALIQIFFFSVIISLAQDKKEEENITGKSPIDTNYIKSYTDKITARLYGLFQEASLRSHSGEFSNLTYRPNIPGRLGIGAVYKWFGLGLSIGIPWIRPSESSYGKTSFYDLRANIYGNPYAAELFIQNFKGYYISNKNNKDERYVIPDMHVFSLGVIGYYFYNKQRFSIRSAFLQNERQKKSAGSLVIRPSFIYMEFSSDNGIVPTELAATFTNTTPEIPKKGHVFSIGLAPGYTYTFVFLKYFYLNAAVYPGALYETGSWENVSGDSHRIKGISLSANIKGAAGYNSPTWFVGFGFSSGLGGFSSELSKADFYYDITQFRIWGGTRFGWFHKKKK